MCSDIDCMPCKITTMSTVINQPILSTAKCSHSYDVETLEPTYVSIQATPTKKKAVPFSKLQQVKRDVKNIIVDNLVVVDETVIIVANNDANLSNDVTAGPNKNWVPNAT